MLSLPFITGTAAACMLPQSSLVLSCGLSIVFCSLLCLFSMKAVRPFREPLVLLLFLGLGFFCGSSAALMPPGESRSLVAEMLPLTGLSAAIDAIGFSDSTANILLKTLLIGDRTLLPEWLSANFRAAGAAHILALSGLHLGILYGALSKVLAVLGNSPAARKVRAGTVIPASLMYCLATGSGPSIVRAFLFITIRELARINPHRRAGNLSVFATAILVQTALDPTVVRSVGFQLSYLAVLGISLFYDGLSRMYPESPYPSPMRRIWNSVAMSLSCQIFTAPLVYLRFHSFPKYFLLANIIALPLSEAFILCSLGCMVFDIPPLLRFCDLLYRFLTESLRIIAGM